LENEFYVLVYKTAALRNKSEGCFSGRGGIELELNHSLMLENEDFLLLTKYLLDAVDAMNND